MQATLQLWKTPHLSPRHLPMPQTGLAVLRDYTAEYLSWGTGEPLVLIPGLAGGVGLVSLLAAHLARQYRVLAFQLRGETEPFVLRRRFDLNDLVDDVAEFMDLLCLERPIVMGVSFGGVLALQFAARYPHRPAAVIAQGVDVTFAPSLLRFATELVLRHYSLPCDNPYVNQFFNLFFGKQCDDLRLLNFVARQCWQTDQSVMAYRFQLAERMDLRPYLPAIRVPTLIITGQLDVLSTAQGVRELELRIPHVEHVRIADAGHFAFVSHADLLADAVYRFLIRFLTS
ncbi:MAG: alpha/beta hydrolase [Gemmatales bacterium]|nr:alpha/beta hydrolase [Gemmatales bacterium]MDW8221940.1 alpha/beta hydrolase [Gemmatales bacterium]